MAHFLSDVTHLRLELRGDDPVCGQDDRSVVHTHDFSSPIRCFDVVPRNDEYMDGVVVWSGDTNGALTIRKGIDGQPIRQVPPPRNVYIYSLLCLPPYVWVGQSDGYMLIFSTESYQKMYEVKAHSGCINCIFSHFGFIFSGGGDWQIVKWIPSILFASEWGGSFLGGETHRHQRRRSWRARLQRRSAPALPRATPATTLSRAHDPTRATDPARNEGRAHDGAEVLVPLQQEPHGRNTDGRLTVALRSSTLLRGEAKYHPTP